MLSPHSLEYNVLTMDLSQVNFPPLIQRYLSGESMQVLAAELGCTPQGLRKALKRYTLSYDGPEYVDLVTQVLIDRIAEADEELSESDDAVSIARARERCRFYRMDLERRRPKLYGQKQQMDVDNKITVTVNKFIHQQGQLPSPPAQVVDSTVLDMTPDAVEDHE